MSVQALSWVFDHSPTTGADRLVLLAIANHAGHVEGDEGPVWESWPSIALIRKEAGLAREQTVRDALKRLIEGGHLSRVVHGAPDERIPGDRRPNLYRILDPTRDVGSSEQRPHARRSNDPTRNAPTTPRETWGKPSLEPSSEPSTDVVQRSLDATRTPAAALDHLPKGVDPEAVKALCLHLRRRITAHHPKHREPPVTVQWVKDMGTLLNSGPIEAEGFVPTATEVAAMIDAVFDRLADRSNSRRFCWADQVNSPGALRRSWVKMERELAAGGHASRDEVVAAMGKLDEMLGGRK